MEHDSEPDAELPSRELTARELPSRELTATGEPRVDAALRQLGELDELPVSGHPPVFERIHGQLVEVLGELHSGTGQADQAAR
jgi:hypothetical protein